MRRSYKSVEFYQYTCKNSVNCMDIIIEALNEWGYIGLFLGSFLAATIIPFSSDIMMVALLATGADTVLTIATATLGNWLGGAVSYYIGYLGRWEWIEKYLRVKREKITTHAERVARYGSLLALLTWVPIVGDIFAIALGFYRINFKSTAIYMFIGKCSRFIVWALIYYSVI